MKVQCKGCRIVFDILDDKVPAGKPFKVLCPVCKQPAESDQKASHIGPEDRVSGLSEKPQPDIGVDRLLDYTSAIDVVEEGVKTALLCDTDLKRAKKIAQALQELDFWVVHASRSSFALGKLHHNTYDIIVLEENFNSERESENLVLHHVQLLPMHLRRQFYICLLSCDKRTMDAKLAFKMGVNLILNFQDLEKAKVLFARAIKEYRNFYGLFLAELAKKQ